VSQLGWPYLNLISTDRSNKGMQQKITLLTAQRAMKRNADMNESTPAINL